MNDIFPSLILIASGGWFFYTARHPEHGNPKAARFTGWFLVLLGAGALVWSLGRRAFY